MTAVATVLSQKHDLQFAMKLVHGVQSLLLVVLSSVPWSHERQLVMLQRVQCGKLMAQALHLLSDESKK
jgi:hypothetical protein